MPTLDSAVIERGLRELNPALHFDMGGKLGIPHPYQGHRQGVFYDGAHICSMDRGIVPEGKVWSVREQWVPVGVSEADHEDATVRFHVLPPWTEGYPDLYLEASEKKRDDLFIRNDGALCRITVWKKMKYRHRVIQVGWRHTFERIISRNLPGLTRRAIAEKFKVELMNVPVGDFADIYAELVEE